MYESKGNVDTYTSTVRVPLRKRHMKSNSVYKTNQYQEDLDSNLESHERFDEYIEVDRTNSSMMNEHKGKKPIKLVNIPNDNSSHISKRNCPFSQLIDSEQKYLTRTHSTVDISAHLNNIAEVKMAKDSIERIKAKIASVTSHMVFNEFIIKECISKLKEMKEKKREITIQLPNLVSEKESYEEIYKTNILKYAQSTNRKGIQHAFKPDCYDNGNKANSITVSKNEIISLGKKEFKETVIAILNDVLTNSKYEILYQNLIESVINKAFSLLMNSNMELCRGELFFLKLSKDLCDIYPTINPEVLTLLLKYSIKLNYIESVISTKMKYLSSEYKARKTELRLNLDSKVKENQLLEAQLIELKAKQTECMSHLDALVDISDKTTLNSSNVFKDSVKRTSMLIFENEESEQSFGNKPVNNNGNKRYHTPNVILKNRTNERHSEEINNDADYSSHNSNSNSNLAHITMKNTKPKAMRKSASISNMFNNKNDSSFSIMDEDKSNITTNTSVINIKTPIKNNNKKHHRNRHLSFEIKDKEGNFSISNHMPKQHQTQLGQGLNNMNNHYSFSSQSNTDIGNQSDYYISLLHDTYCYCKFLTKSDPKFNPLLPYSNTPELLGYDKGFISYHQSSQSLLFSSYIHKQRKYRIKLSSIQSLIVINLIKDIITIHKSYQNMLLEFTGKSIDVDAFIHRKEFDSIGLDNNDKIKSALCSSFSFSIVLASNEKIELIFVNYNEF